VEFDGTIAAEANTARKEKGGGTPVPAAEIRRRIV
jgi:hypothetical protein